MHMISKKDLNNAEMDTLTKSCSPTIVITANGEVQTHEEATVHVKELDTFLTMRVLENTLAVLSLGKLCDENGYSYEWINGQHGTCTHERDKSPDREVRSCLHSNVCAKRTCHFRSPLVALSLRSVVVPVFVDVTTDSHVHLFFLLWHVVDSSGLYGLSVCPDGASRFSWSYVASVWLDFLLVVVEEIVETVGMGRVSLRFRSHGEFAFGFPSCSSPDLRMFSYLFSYRCRVRFFVLTLLLWGKLSDLSPDFLSCRLGAQTEFRVSHILPGRAIHWRLQ